MKKYRIGYALSGGGARGFAHAGAIKALEEFGIKPDIISGTSAGSVVGALYSSGKSPEDIKNLFLEKSTSDFLSLTMPKSGFFKTDSFIEFLKKNISYKNIQNLPIPLYITATNFDKGKSIVFKTGELVPRIMASCCIPVVFNLLKINNTHYADGGIFKNLPASPIRDLCEIVIGINVGPALPEYKESLVFVAQQTYHYMLRANMLEDEKLCDILLETKAVSPYSIFDIKNAEKIFKLGYQNMKKNLKNISPKVLEQLNSYKGS